jgi:hypothetical protein
MNTSLLLRASAVAFGAALLASASTAVMAAEIEHGAQDVDVNVAIAEIEGPGGLALTVDTAATTLVEGPSTELERIFTGTLPKVTVTDTRAPEDVPAGSAWYVLGSASAFVDAESDATIGADHLGWSPQLVAGEGEGESFVEVGGDVMPSDPGLVDQELLYLADSAESNAGGGVFSATAGLQLVVPASVAAGNYTSTLTLSLFE